MFCQPNPHKKNEISGAITWVVTPSEIEALCKHLECETVIAVDTESDSLFSYFEKVCLLQVSTQEMDYIVDPLALRDTNGIASFGTVFADEKIEKIFHATQYDILCLKRDYGFEFRNVFDTMVAARILGWKNVGLGNVLQEQFGILLDKKMQRTNWGHRPLTAQQIDYAAKDTHHLIALRRLQINELEKLGRLEEAYEEFDRLTRVQPVTRCFNPNAYWKIRGAKELDQNSLGVLRELFRFRDKQARKENRPVFKVIPDHTLLSIASIYPRTTQDLLLIHGISHHTVQLYGHAILDAIDRGYATPQTTEPCLPSNSQLPFDIAARVRLARLKDWRRQRAIARGVDTDVIVSNDVLFATARENPQTIDAFTVASNLGKWKLKEYGEEIMEVLK
ncbi:HRDC domain-containing protein [Candidatus Desantisbacteria bacterium]|nr:HRDC domain-containing protein [Candidatus Desantisbacteria bacterium]